MRDQKSRGFGLVCDTLRQGYARLRNADYLRIASARKGQEERLMVAPISKPWSAATNCDFRALHSKVGNELESWDG